MSPANTGLDPKVLTPYQARSFVPTGADLADVEQVKVLYQKLIDRSVDSAATLEALLLDRSELEAAIQQHQAILQINMTCHTDDTEKAKAYKAYLETIPPAAKTLADKLDKKYLDLIEKYPFDQQRYYVYNRAIRTDVKLFRTENVPLQTQLDLLCQQYQTVCGAMTVDFAGAERTMPQMHKYLYEPDRTLRESAWNAAADRRLADAEKLDEIFDEMLDLRIQIAHNAGFSNYRDYIFREYHRFDYTVDDCKAFHDSVEKSVIPLLANIYSERKIDMSLDSLRPWDLYADPKSRPSLKPFETVDQLIAGCQKIFTKLDTELAHQFKQMSDLGLLDLDSRTGKAPGGYQETLNEARKPFIFANAVGVDQDVLTLLHESGHAFHAFARADDPLVNYRHAPIEFCEVASMSMELLAGDHIDILYCQPDAHRSLKNKFEQIVYILPWVATIDAFQHWLYENPGHTHADRNKAFIDIHNRFAGQFIDFTDLAQKHENLWHRQLHIFQFPFYYIEYGIAQLGALGLWLQSKKDTVSAIANYKKALALGGSKPLPELFKAARLEFDFSQKTIEPLMNAVADELQKLGN